MTLLLDLVGISASVNMRSRRISSPIIQISGHSAHQAQSGDLYLGDNGKIFFGNDQDVELIHDPDDGLILDLGTTDGNGDPQFQITSQTTGANGGTLRFLTESSSPASSDRVGTIAFAGKDDAGNTQDYGFIYGRISDPTSTTEAGKISILAYPASVNNRGLHVEGVGTNIGQVKVNIDHDGSTYGLHLNNTLVTARANELNLLDSRNSTVGASITIIDTDGIIVNDGGTTKLVPASALKTYVGASGSTIPDVVIAGDTGDVSASFASAGSNGDNERTYLINNSATARTVTLPAVSGNSAKKLHIKRLGTANVTIAVQSGEALETTTNGTFVLNAQYSAVTVVCNATGTLDGWFII